MQNTISRFGSVAEMKLKRAGVLMLLLGLVLASVARGQQTEAVSGRPLNPVQATGSSTVPRLITFSGTINPQIAQTSQNRVQSPGPQAAFGLTFSLYELQQDGAPLWSESQNVQLDDQGHYTVLLGATQPDGLPLDLFTSGKAQWLGVQPQLPGAAELPRVLLVGMPYALKAADSDTLGGLPVSAFVQAAATASSLAGSGSAAGPSSPQAPSEHSNTPFSLSGTGLTDFLPLWTNSTTLGSSVLFQSGTGTSAKLGVNTTTPASTLDVNGGATVHGNMSLPATGTASASTGKNSHPASLQASSFNSGTNAAVSQSFNLQAEPTGNNTSNPSGKLNLLFASGSSTPAETGLSISSNGQITFASGQSFPGTGTITGLTTASGSGLTGGGTTGTLTLGLQKTCATDQVLEWNGSSWVCASMGTGTIAGVTAGTDLTGGGTSGTVTLNLDTTKVPQLAGSNNFTGNQSVTGNVTATGVISGSSFSGSGSGLIGVNAAELGGQPSSYFASTVSNFFAGAQSINGNGDAAIIGDMGCGTGYVGLTLYEAANCQSYSMLGDTAGNLYLNRLTGGTIYFRESNADEMTISPGGAVAINANNGVGALTAVGNADTITGIMTYGGGEGGVAGGDGIFAQGGSESSTSGAAGGNGIYAAGGNGAVGGDGVFGIFGSGLAPPNNGYAGDFAGNVAVNGNLFKSGGSFKIDHPLDPPNKYLYHSFVESPDMMNIYNGVVQMDANGEATVQLPGWFEALNRDFRYQLTCIGSFAPVYVAEEMANNQFKIAGGKPGMKISWLVTGIRQDAWANAHRIPVEVNKPERERGYYLAPELFGAPEEKGIEWARHPQTMKRIKEQRARATAAKKK